MGARTGMQMCNVMGMAMGMPNAKISWLKGGRATYSNEARDGVHDAFAIGA